MTLEEIVNNLKSAGQDYGQLFNNNPRMDNFASVLQQGLGQLIPSNADFKSPEAMRDWGTAAALNAPMGLTFTGPKSMPLDQLINRYGDNGPSMSMSIKNPNLNAGLLNKHLSGQKLTPKEMAQYEANALKMETPQLQRYNVSNAMANPERNAHMGSYDVYPYHGTNDVITAPDYAFSGKGADQLGSAAIYTSKQPSLASGFTNPDISGGNVLPLALKNTNKYMSDELKKKLTPAQLREFITKSPDEYALSNFGDVGYEGKNKVINTAVQGYHQYGDEKLLDTLNLLNNDFYRGNPEEFNKLAGKLTKKAGVVMDTGENKIYAPWNTKDIRSKFAAFDPLRKNSSSLLASGLLGSLLLKQMNQESSQQ